MIKLLASIAAAEIVVYAPESSSPLQVSWAARESPLVAASSFPACFTGHRAVATVPHASTNDAFAVWTGSSSFSVSDPFGCSNLRPYPAVDLAPHSPISPRIDLWSTSNDRSEPSLDGDPDYVFDVGPIPATNLSERVRVLRSRVDNYEPFHSGSREECEVLDKTFEKGSRTILHEGDFLTNGVFDIDWLRLQDDVVNNMGVRLAGCPITNIDYLVVFGDADLSYSSVTETNITQHIRVHPTLIKRRFEVTKTAPTPTTPLVRSNDVSVAWKIVGEDPWASEFGSTYTAFKVNAYLGTETNDAPWYSSGVMRMPPKNLSGEYRHVIRGIPGPTSLTWQVFTYNAKFRADTSPSAPQTIQISY